jgi:hypothetical protein
LGCWFGSAGPLKADYVYHAEADPPGKGGKAEISIHERNRLSDNPKGLRAYRIGIALEGDSTALTFENVKMPEAMAKSMEADARRWKARRNPFRKATSGGVLRSRHHGLSVAVLLNARRPQARKPMLVDRSLPGEKLVDGQLIAVACLLDAEQATANGSDHFRFTADHPTLRIFRREIRNRQRAPIGPDNVAHPRSHLLLGHDTHYTLADQLSVLDQHD